MQDLNSFKSIKSNYTDSKIQVDDILKIDISVLDKGEVILFNNSNTTYQSNVEMMKLSGYLVKNDGKITFPLLGDVLIEGLSLKAAQQHIYELLLDQGHLVNHSVEIRILNLHVTVLGDVRSPGSYSYYENNMNVLKALGMAGDLNITGDRKDVKLIRQNKGTKEIHSIDLTKSETLNNDVFLIKSGDIIIVNPNLTKVKNAGVIGNSGTLLSLLSFILTSIILINR
jgi:polysaccharide export outer membrane protein